MKKIRTLMLTALALIMGAMTAFASPENPTLHVQRRSLSGSNITPCRRMERNALTVATCSIIPYRTRPFTTCWI